MVLEAVIAVFNQFLAPSSLGNGTSRDQKVRETLICTVN